MASTLASWRPGSRAVSVITVVEAPEDKGMAALATGSGTAKVGAGKTCGGLAHHSAPATAAKTVSYEVLRELLREARQFTAREMRVVASTSVIDLFLEEESQALAMLSEFIGLPISLHAESGYTQEQFDIVLM